MVPLMALMLIMGLYPRPIISRMEPAITEVIARVHSAQAKIDEEKKVAHLTAPARSSALASLFPFSKGKGLGVRSE